MPQSGGSSAPVLRELAIAISHVRAVSIAPSASTYVSAFKSVLVSSIRARVFLTTSVAETEPARKSARREDALLYESSRSAAIFMNQHPQGSG